MYLVWSLPCTLIYEGGSLCSTPDLVAFVHVTNAVDVGSGNICRLSLQNINLVTSKNILDIFNFILVCLNNITKWSELSREQ